MDRRGTPFLTHKMCAAKRSLGAFDTDLAYTATGCVI
jgi:hypothetical protein